MKLPQAWTSVCQEAYAMASELKLDGGGREGEENGWSFSRFQVSLVTFFWTSHLEFHPFQGYNQDLSSMSSPKSTNFIVRYHIYLFQYTTLEPFLFSSTKKPRVSNNFPSFAPFSLQESPQIQLTLEHEHCAELEGDVTTQDFEEAVGWWWFLSSLLLKYYRDWERSYCI